MVEAAYQRTLGVLTEHKSQLDTLAKTLLEKEVIFKEDLETIFGKRKFEKEEMAVRPKPDFSIMNGNGTAKELPKSDTPKIEEPVADITVIPNPEA